MASFDHIHIIINSCVAILSISFATLAVIIVMRHTPSSFSKFGIMIRMHALVDLSIALGSSTTMPRVFPIDWSAIAYFYGPCRFFGSTACFIPYILVVGGQACTVFTLLASFIFRLMVIRGRSPTTFDVCWLICGIALPPPVMVSNPIFR
ncbi:hypothetical protein PENTCL1PPCAC_14320 [Pristionchus entomophagus]|uniref:G protein-coupled receptor n=1 Tax=Pristionchus entomophagus TaxID=358040 RepID=A0AAV5TFU4_9BILA|nr:hypothetical protein PENTCL1PPCAC_14320 [Pristionchus entomophagus]